MNNGKLLGEGAFGEVYLHNIDNKPAIRKHVIRNQDYSEEVYENVQAAQKKECKIIGKLKNEHIVKLYPGENCNNAKTDMYLEYYDGGDLHTMIQKMKNMPTNIRLQIALFFLKQLTQAVLYCHNNGICHMDIKPANCLLQKGTWNLALADFGISIELQYDNNMEIPMKAQLQGTPGFVAPELNSNSMILYSKLDIYAIGIVFLQMLTGSDLCKYFNDNNFCFQQNPEVEFCNNKYISDDMMKYPKEIRDLLNRICEYNPNQFLLDLMLLCKSNSYFIM
jgi:serine/threonine protein kinase